MGLDTVWGILHPLTNEPAAAVQASVSGLYGGGDLHCDGPLYERSTDQPEESASIREYIHISSPWILLHEEGTGSQAGRCDSPVFARRNQ